MTEREQTLILATLEVLKAMGSLLLAEEHVRRGVRLKTEPKATPSEVGDALFWAESRGLILSQRDDFNTLKYKLTDAGKAWLKEHA